MKPQIIGAKKIIGSLYLATCRTTNKSYVGITKMPVARRWSDHARLARKGVDTALYNAIRKYGVESFDVKILVIVGTWDFLCELETKAIVAFGTRAPSGYNLTDGGDGAPGVDPERIKAGLRRSPPAPMTDAQKIAVAIRSKAFWKDAENRQRVSVAHQEKWNDPGHRERHRSAVSAAFNTDNEKRARSQRTKALWANEEYRIKVRDRATAATRTEENRKAQSERIKGMWADPQKRARMMQSRRVGDAPTNNF